MASIFIESDFRSLDHFMKMQLWMWKIYTTSEIISPHCIVLPPSKLHVCVVSLMQYVVFGLIFIWEHKTTRPFCNHYMYYCIMLRGCRSKGFKGPWPPRFWLIIWPYLNLKPYYSQLVHPDFQTFRRSCFIALLKRTAG